MLHCGRTAREIIKISFFFCQIRCQLKSLCPEIAFTNENIIFGAMKVLLPWNNFKLFYLQRLKIQLQRF